MANPVSIYIGCMREGDNPRGTVIEFFAESVVDEGEVGWVLKNSQVDHLERRPSSFGDVVDEFRNLNRFYHTLEVENFTVIGPYIRCKPRTGNLDTGQGFE